MRIFLDIPEPLFQRSRQIAQEFGYEHYNNYVLNALLAETEGLEDAVKQEG